MFLPAVVTGAPSLIQTKETQTNIYIAVQITFAGQQDMYFVCYV